MRLAGLLALTLLLTACSTTRYYYQIAHGHLSLLASAEPIDKMLDTADPEVAAALELVQRARAFAGSELGLSFNDSYTSYVDLDRDYVVQNLYAAPEFSTELYSWCYWIIGCANYRGFFDGDMLQKERDHFAEQGFDTYISTVTAYSTLGWFDDPVLSTFIDLPEYRLVGLVIHELAHQQPAAVGKLCFNRSRRAAMPCQTLRHPDVRTLAAGGDALGHGLADDVLETLPLDDRSGKSAGRCWIAPGRRPPPAAACGGRRQAGCRPVRRPSPSVG